MPGRTPIVVVLGTTGAGKSKLAIEIAQRFGGEVISADAVQMYRGLDIVTNKVTVEERSLVKHHCIDFLHPLIRYNVVDFRNMALPIVEGLLKEGKVPVICGGTNYYIESLLWKVLLDDHDKKQSQQTGVTEAGEESDLVDLSNQELYQKLIQVDPPRAEELHVNDRRKVLRSLQVFRRQNRRHSDILKEQRGEQTQAFLGGPLRFPADQVVVIWVQCDQKVLDDRCDRRVEKMVEEGMIEEMTQFQQDFGADGSGSDQYTKGIFQTIGFKEFHDYLHLDSQDDSHKRQRMWDEGVKQMKLRTRQYARRQLKWINQRFLNSRGRDLPRVYGVDSSRYPDGWDADVHDPAAKVVQAYVDGCPHVEGIEPLPLVANAHSYDDTRKVLTCDLCNLQLRGKIQLEAHLNSKNHKFRVKMVQRNAELELALKSTTSQNTS